MSWVRKLEAMIDRRKRDKAKKHNTSKSAVSWYQQEHNRKRNKKARNRRHRKLTRLQRQRTARQ